MKRKSLFLAMLALSTVCITGCTDNEVKKLQQLEPASNLSADRNVTAVSALSSKDREALIYNQVSDRNLIDTTTLDEVVDSDVAVIEDYINSACEELKGSSGEVLSDGFVNYILAEQEKTPYTWEKSNVEILGLDSASHSYVVDVTFSTTGSKKDVKPKTPIPLGCPDYAIKAENRLTKYIELLDMKRGTSDEDSFKDYYKDFVKVYGDPEDIIKAQQDYSLRDEAKDGKFITYTCNTDSSYENTAATMKVRFILTYNYAYGINLGITCDHLYITDYSLVSNPLEDREPQKTEEAQNLEDSVDYVIYSYNRCIDDNNYSGLNSLIKDFGNYDKYYYDMFEYSYRKIQGYTVSIYEVNGTKVLAGVTRVRKSRAKGTEMSYPSYEEKLLYELELVDDKLLISNEVLLSSSLVGEPAIVSNAEGSITGFTSKVEISSQDKKDITEVINKIGQLQVDKIDNGDDFEDVVDISVSAKDLEDIKETLYSIDVVRKYSWIKSYNIAYTNYIQLTALEVFYMEDGTAYECNTTMSFIYKNNSKWQLVGYTRTSMEEINGNSVSDKSAIAVNNRSDGTKVKEKESKINIATTEATTEASTEEETEVSTDENGNPIETSEEETSTEISEETSEDTTEEDASAEDLPDMEELLN